MPSTSAEAKPQRSRPGSKLDLRELALEKGFKSLNALAIAAGVSQPTVSNAHRGGVPRPLIAAAIARALEVTHEVLLDAISISGRRAKRSI